ncbi:MAG: hypothetical protein RL385_2944 [Pseudomonadota bacterium]|jgi:DNA-binding transcriptional LysR family regulator
MHDLTRLAWDDLRLFLAVVRAGSFTRAARQAGVDQSTITRRMRSLESQLGSSLFERSHAGLSPSALCAPLRQHAERMETAFFDCLAASAQANAEPAGRVRLATTESFATQVLIPRLLGPFRKAYPRISLDLVLGDKAADLAHREADLALRFFKPQKGDLRAKHLLSLPMAVLGQRAYVARVQRKRAAYDWIAHTPPGVIAPEARFLAQIGAKEPAYTVTSHLAQVEAVRAGLGVALLTRELMRLFPELVEVPLDVSAAPKISVWLVTPESLRHVPRIDALFGYLAAELPKMLQA